MSTGMIFTIDSDEEIEKEVDPEEVEEARTSSGRRKAKKMPLMKFDFDDGRISDSISRARDESDGEISESGSEQGDDDNVKAMPRIEERARRAMAKKQLKEASDDSEDDKDDELDDDGEDQDDIDDEEDEKEYFDAVVDSNEAPQVDMFSQFTLSRSILRAIESMGYVTPTEVQAKVIPLALGGRDVCASALTGSGKTAAFVIPFLERLLFRPKDQAAIRVIIVSPTRELASQTFEVVQKLAQYTDITSALICGGKKDVRSQSVELRKRPDVVVGTPGRLIDHLMNTTSVRVDLLDVLVLDEVDRLLDLGFQDEIHELVKHCPKSRQTLLFSATMTSKVEDLAKLSLKKPVRVKTQGNASTTALRLVQEFVRLRKDEEREAVLAALLCRTQMTRTIVFFETKKEAHRFQIVLSLLGTKAAEMHGDLPQIQRNHALQRFKDGSVAILIATDVASRGIDITGVHCVVNAEMPRSVSTYIHRVGRTARAGSSGRSVTVVSDARRKVLKALLKGGDASNLSDNGSQNILQRTVPTIVVSEYIEKIAGLEGEIADAMQNERENRQLDEAMMEAERAENLLLHEDEINSRPSRAWYQSEGQKKAIAEASKEVAKKALDDINEDGDVVKEKKEKKGRFVGRDEYLTSEEKPRKHSISRKKRRRQDALAELEEEPVKFTGKKKLIEQRDKVKEVSDKRSLEKKRANKEAAAAAAAVKAAKKAKDLANGVVNDDDAVKMHFKYLKKGGKAGKASFKSNKKFKRR